ncbi:terminase small subunit [Hymenobacter fodinae]|uniref:Terminase small subunit n=1 Tax=Hymenobacter fodinae TaxID=2510796 RepID=A0A4Z0P9W2_9BACT|nr:terminase small subunit [Hymenobacter fodinae]TGE08765.1 terminase small subunit [Hymenobacter fodinae]
MDTPNSEEQNAPDFTDKRKRFIEEYPVDCNATQAAIRAGFSAKTARQMGSWLLTNIDIRNAVDERLKTLAMTADEAVKHIGDIAKTRLNDYLKVETRTRRPTIQQPLGEAIDQLEAELAFEKKYTTRSLEVLQLQGDELKEYQAERNRVHKRLQLQIIRFECELSENPEATRDIDGPPEEYEAVQVDMVALAKTNDLGRIKAFSWTEFGPKVEMYPADAALRDILRMHGKYEKDNEQSAPKVMPEIKVYTGAPPLSNSEKEVDL